MRNVDRLYVLIVLATVTLICGITALFNLYIDPYGTYRLFETGESIWIKPAAYRRVKLVKAYDLRRLQPEAIVLGSSRSHIALRMSHEGWSVPLDRRYNSAFDGATTKEMYAYLLHAYAVHPLRQVVLGLDFWQLGRGPAWTRPDFDGAILFKPNAKIHNVLVYLADLSLLISIDTAKASIQLMREPNAVEPQWLAADGQRLGEIFFRQVEPTYSISPGAYFRTVDRREIEYMTEDVRAAPIGQNKLSPIDSNPAFSSFDYIAKIVAFCREHNIDLRIFLTPAHAHQLEIAAQLGGWSDIERGKRDLVNLLSQDAASHPGASPFTLFDFCNYSSVTTESVPAAGSRREMRYYWDSSHFKEKVGDWVLDRLFGTTQEGDPVPVDFGTALNRNTIDSTLETIRAKQIDYRRKQPEEIKFIKSLIGQIKTQALVARQARQ